MVDEYRDAFTSKGQAAHSLKLQNTLNPEEFLTFNLLNLEFLVNTRNIVIQFQNLIKDYRHYKKDDI